MPTPISALTPAATPLAGTEEVAIVQAGQTRKVAAQDLGGGGSGEGGINYISNGRFEANVDGWTAQANLTFTRNTTSPLRGAGDGQLDKPASDESDKTVSTDFTVDPADVLSVMAIRFAYTTDANYVSDDFRVQVIADPTGTPVTIYDQPLLAGSGAEFADYFSTTSATSYRFQLVCNTTSATTRQINIDTVQVGPNQISVGPNVGDWQDASAYGLTVAFGWDNQTTTARARRVGDSIELQIETVLSANPTMGQPYYTLSGLTVDNNRVNGGNYQTTGTAHFLDTGTREYIGQPAWNAGQNYIQLFHTEAGNVGNVDNANPFAWGAGDIITVVITLPIQGWAANAPVSPMSQPYLWGERFAASASIVTAAPAKLGEYRAWRKTGNTNVGTGVDTTPSTLPTAADGLRAYALNYAATGVVGEPNAYDIYVGIGMEVSLRAYLNTGRAGTVYVDPVYWRSDAGTQANLGINWHYDPVTGIVRVDASKSANDQNDVMRFGTTTAGGEVSDGYFDLLVSPKSNPLALTSEGWTQFQRLSADPSGAEDGAAYYNTTTNKLRLRAAGVWVDLN